MELEELRFTLEKRSLTLSTMDYAPVERSTLHSSSRSIMNKVLKSIRWEAAFSVLCGTGALFLLFAATSVPVSIFLAAICVYAMGFAYYLLRLHARIKSHILTVKSVKDCLADTIDILERFTRLYGRLAAGFVPCAFIAAFIAGFVDFLLSEGRIAVPYFAIGIALPIIALWIFLTRKFTRWYLHRLFGNYLSEMRAHRAELTSE